MDLYIYRITSVDRVVDGDTYDLVVDVGFQMTTERRFRLNGWNTPEIFGSKATEAGQEAKAFVETWFDEHLEHKLYIRSYKAGNFGRWLCDVFCGDEHNLLEELKEGELGAPYTRS